MCVVFHTEFRAKRDKREQEHGNPGIDHSDIIGRHFGRAGYGADYPGGGEWRSADQRPHRSARFCSACFSQHFW